MSAPLFQNFHLPVELDGSQMVAALKVLLGGTSWGVARKAVIGRRVQVNGNLCLDEARKLKTGDVIKVWERPLAKPANERDVVIVFYDADLVVVHKPSGLTTLRHPEEKDWPARRRQIQPTLDELVPRALAREFGMKLPDLETGSKAGLNSKRSRRHPARRGESSRSMRQEPKLPGIRAVHRLDRDTSGLMVFARTEQAEIELVRLFRKHTIDRAYYAVVQGHVKAQTIKSLLTRDRGDGLRGSLPAGRTDPEAQKAVTHIKPLKRLGAYSLVECRLETGRTHQIRIHLSEIGHMLCGEKTYTHRLGEKPRTDESNAPRQVLHAAELGFIHPITMEELHFKAPLPEDLRDWLSALLANQ